MAWQRDSIGLDTQTTVICSSTCTPMQGQSSPTTARLKTANLCATWQSSEGPCVRQLQLQRDPSQVDKGERTPQLSQMSLADAFWAPQSAYMRMLPAEATLSDCMPPCMGKLSGWQASWEAGETPEPSAPKTNMTACPAAALIADVDASGVLARSPGRHATRKVFVRPHP